VCQPCCCVCPRSARMCAATDSQACHLPPFSPPLLNHQGRPLSMKLWQLSVSLRGLMVAAARRVLNGSVRFRIRVRCRLPSHARLGTVRIRQSTQAYVLTSPPVLIQSKAFTHERKESPRLPAECVSIHPRVCRVGSTRTWSSASPSTSSSTTHCASSSPRASVGRCHLTALCVCVCALVSTVKRDGSGFYSHAPRACDAPCAAKTP
jgi:hypothetical protein